MQNRILKRTGLLQLNHAIVVNHSDLWNRFDCDQAFINRDYQILHIRDDMKLRLFFETEYREKPSEKQIIVIEANAFHIPYDIVAEIQVVELSYAVLFPMLDAGVLESLPGLDYDHLAFVADRAAVRPMDRKETLAFCTDGLNTPEWSADYAAKLLEEAYAVSLVAKSHRDWMRAAKLFGKASMFQHSGVEITGYREKREEIEKAFVCWIGEKYAGLHGVSDLQRPVLLSKVNDFIRKGNDRIALILMDGMSFEDFFTIRRESVSAPFTSDVEASFSFFPTVTSVARQSVFSGKLPKELDDPFSMGNEEKAWREYWTDHGYKPQEIAFVTVRHNEFPEIPPQAKVVSILIDICDELTHGELQGLYGLLQGIGNWMRNGLLTEIIKTLHDRGFAVFMTADHGNTSTVAEGMFKKPGVLADPASRRAVVYKDFADAIELEKFDTVEYTGTYLPEGCKTYLFAEGSCYGVPGKEYITHGGMTIEEAIVPFVKIGAYHG